ncbi:S8 family peptidase [Streptomyces cavernae]|uniref:S8 family peptidase n=1 Tax=Streptomyces cavernae TaxID=2259034 RepID=UPI000FEBDC15|nr:S8 family serine peptidase [Streptomyces cavernae]
MTSSASARPERAQSAEATAQLAPKQRITLITGDRVVVDARGKVVGFERAEGREHIPVQIRKANGHTLVVPGDVRRLIAAGKVDRRLFDVTELTKAAARKASALKVIVGYKGAATAAKADVRDAGDTKVTRTLKTLNADAVVTPKDDASELWSAVTDKKGDEATTASGIAHVWLDGVRQASLDKSVPQIGAPKAWAAGYDGKGVKIAVLDTGVDATHPDLKTQVVESKNFSAAADTTDHYGHGTHVASIAAGTGAKSKGKYKGVAPGAKILNGKVLDDSGFGEDSGILAGMEWAAAQGADVINLSLGGPDSAALDPLEAAVNKLSAAEDVLFAIAAGNSGELGAGTVGSPASADAALSVGAVDDKDKLASFSSRGPRIGDGAIKPDVTAPGVDTTAASAAGSVIAKEVGENPAGYTTISGTSMATPHVAGAAAILKQQHPDWKYTDLKAALTGSAKGGKYSPYEQGSGRIAVDKAIKQTVLAEPSSVGFGVQQWPHTDDKPVTDAITYRNLGKTDVTLSLSVTATNPKGQAAPAGFFKLGATKVTVPAGREAAVDLTVDTRLGGSVDGSYYAYVTATGGGQSVRTAAAVQREVESYDVTLKHIGPDGQPAAGHLTDLFALSGLAKFQDFQAYGDEPTETVRVPKGNYLVDAWIGDDLDSPTAKGALDWLVQPRLSVIKDVTLTLDARTTKPADITVPDAQAKPETALASYTDAAAGWSAGVLRNSFKDIRMAHLGPEVSSGIVQTWTGQFTKGTAAEYDVITTAKAKKIVGAHVRHFKAGELARVKTNLGASTAGKTGAVMPFAVIGEESGFGRPVDQKLPTGRTLYLSTGQKVQWTFDFLQYSGAKDPQGNPIPEAYYSLGNPQVFKAGKSYTKTFNVGVFGPRIDSVFGVYRENNSIYGLLPMFADGQTHAGASDYTSVKSTLYRNGKKIAETADALDGAGEFKVPSADASYRLTTSIKRSVKDAAASTRIDASWTFRSKKVDEAKLPVSTVRFKPSLTLDSRAAAGKTGSFPVTVQGAAAGRNLKSLAVYVSYDYGKTWKKLTVKNGKVTVKNPAAGKGISFHAKIADKKGNKSTISIYNAYYGK